VKSEERKIAGCAECMVGFFVILSGVERSAMPLGSKKSHDVPRAFLQ
jgi:hypothetical protein